jgi:carboxyl-terminal processing protease
VLGTPTFGTGSRQSLIPLEGGTALLISDAKYYSPANKDLQLDGVSPDVVVAKNNNRPDLNSAQTLETPLAPIDPRSEAELQLERAIQILKETQPAKKAA